MSGTIEICTSITFLERGIDYEFGIIYHVRFKTEEDILVGLVPLKTATMNGAFAFSFQNKPPQGP
jgi:hypothetical protein